MSSIYRCKIILHLNPITDYMSLTDAEPEENLVPNMQVIIMLVS